METADFFRARIDAMINLKDPLAVLATRLPWAQIEASVAAKFERQERAGQTVEGHDMFGPTQVLVSAGISSAGRPKLPIRLMASLLYPKHSFNLSDDELVARWSENVLWQFFSGMDYYEHRAPCDATQIGRFRRDLGEEGLEQLLKATIDTAVAIKAVKPKELERVIVDTTVQEKAIAHPVDSRLLSKSAPQGRQRRQARRHRAQADLCQGGQRAASPGRWLRARQAVPAPEEGRQAPAHDPGHRHARGAAQEAKATWTADPSIDVWLIWNIWQVASPALADVVEIAPDYAIYRDTGVAITSRGKDKPQAQKFVEFLQSPAGAAIFAKWGWKTN